MVFKAVDFNLSASPSPANINPKPDVSSPSPWGNIDRIGAPTQFFINSERYRFARPDVNNPQFYPIPQNSITRDTYMRYMESLNLEVLAKNPDRGEQGLRAFLPILAKYVECGEAQWAEACISMLKHYHTAMQKRVEKHDWLEDFEMPAVTIPLYRKYLLDGGAIEAETTWFKDLTLYYCRNLHVWGSEPTEWRGGCHRSMPEGTIKWLASQWYPDIPEAEHWTRYGKLVFNDFWKIKDVPQNDTGYMMGPLVMLVYNGDLITGDDRIYTDPGMQRLWERLMLEVTSDGAVNPYGPNGGYNSTADYRLSMLERIAAKTGDGRFRFVAHKLMNYMRYQSQRHTDDDYLLDPLHAAFAYLFADDAIKPIEPGRASRHTLRNEAMRVPHTNKELTEKLLGNADPRKDKGHICCSWVMNEQQWPDKFIFRSGWNPGDFFCLVELHPTSFPANPGGIMGLNRYGAPFTQIVTSKGSSEENRLLVEDIDGTTQLRYNPDSNRIDEKWKSGTMPDIHSEVVHFEDTQDATFAKVRVHNPDALPIIYEREFIFVKNRFLVSREMVTFEESFHARVTPLWNTQNIGPQLGDHWANTFMSAPAVNNGQASAKTPPVDLLVWFAPQPDCRLQVVDRMTLDMRTTDCPAQLRYTWEGTPMKGDQKVFTQVYYPHMPYRFRTHNNNPSGSRQINEPSLKATAHASGITVLRDDVEASVLKLELAEGEVEYIVFNPEGLELNIGKRTTSQQFAYWSSKSR
ncbi:MAG TPA: hypothetical protein EYQ50_16480 [Verrucomicrobiales bacterium]|nr:hypothetical protein [Verrucomicrobiales bacterium]